MNCEKEKKYVSTLYIVQTICSLCMYSNTVCANELKAMTSFVVDNFLCCVTVVPCSIGLINSREKNNVNKSSGSVY